jgi:hypothetical protein
MVQARLTGSQVDAGSPLEDGPAGHVWSTGCLAVVLLLVLVVTVVVPALIWVAGILAGS